MAMFRYRSPIEDSPPGLDPHVRSIGYRMSDAVDAAEHHTRRATDRAAGTMALFGRRARRAVDAGAGRMQLASDRLGARAAGTARASPMRSMAMAVAAGAAIAMLARWAGGGRR